MAVIKDLGAVTAYAAAVEGGYTGTKAEFAPLMASYATVAEEAAESAESASQSATQAGASAQTATTKASEASTSATQASASATSASQSASTATTKASEASASASTASTKASEASTSATTASSKASEASASATSAQTAQGLAESARDGAIDAKTDAETARDMAQQYAESIDPEKIYSAYPTDTASGSVASFADGADDIPMKSVKVAIEPVPDLHGQSSPYPAGGGKNKFDQDTVYASYKQSDGSFIGVASNINLIRVNVPSNLVGQTLTFSASVKIPSESTINNIKVIAVVNGENIIGNSVEASTYTTTRVVFTPISTDDLFYISYGSWASQLIQFKDVQLEIGSTPTTYAPYSNICPISGWTGAQVSHSGADRTNPTTYPITFPSEAGTVYGGELDVTNGVLTVDRAMITKNTADMNNTATDYPGWRNSGIKDIIGAGFNGFVPHPIMNVGTVCGANTTASDGGIMMLPKAEYGKTQDEWKALAIDVQAVLPLETPITYTLTPTEIKSLLGDNNVWADAGDTTVTYRADTAKYIDKKIAEVINALS